MRGGFAFYQGIRALTTHYADLWYDACTAQLPTATDTPHMTATTQPPSATSTQPMSAINAFRQDPLLPNNDWANLTPEWHRDHALRTDYARHQALVEIGALAAKALGLALDEPQTICRIQFPVMGQHAAETYYDANGRIVFAALKGLPVVGLPRKAVIKGRQLRPDDAEGHQGRHRPRLGGRSRLAQRHHRPPHHGRLRSGRPRRQRWMVYHTPFDIPERERYCEQVS